MLEILTTIMGVMMSLAYYPQAYKIYKNKSAKNVSISSFIIFSVGTATWLAYGIYLKDAPLVISFVFGVLGSWLVLVLSIVYRDNKNIDQNILS